MDESSAGESFDQVREDEARERLRSLLVEKGFLTASNTARLFSRSGRSMSWMLYTPAITMTSEGSRLAGRCLLGKLELFKSAQLAVYGYTGLPLMTASLMLADGRYRGLVVRDKPNSGARGVVEGDGSRPGPVVVIDDSLVSGTSFFQAARLLEEDGFQVEGLLCLVEFPGRGGRARAEAAGFLVEAVYELERDLEIGRLETTTSGLSLQSASTQAAGAPLDPVVVARRVAEAWPNSDRVAEEASCPQGQTIHSGALVEFRDRKTRRLVARDGVVSPGGPISCTAAVAATVKAMMHRSGSQLKNYGLDCLCISVKLLTQAEEIAPREIAATRYALIVQSQLNPSRVGYALHDGRNRTEIALYLAAQQMAGLGPAEPHTIYRCLEEEMTEPGVVQFPARLNIDIEAPVMAALAEIARAEICGIPTTAPDAPVAAKDLEELNIHGAGVAWYEDGRLLGCWVSWGSSLTDVVRRASVRAWQLCGRTQPTMPDAQDLNVLITILQDPRHLGELNLPAAAESFDLGEETLVASAGERSAAVFPHFVCLYGLSGRQTAEMVLRKAKISGASAHWSAYRTTSWLDGHGGQHPIQHGFPAKPACPPASMDRFLRSACAVGDFIARHMGPDGLPVYRYDPLTDTVVRDGPIGRIIFALDALAEATSVLGNEEWAVIARRGLQVCVDQLTMIGDRVSLEVEGRPSGAAADCELLATLASWLPDTLEQPAVLRLAQQVRMFFKADGMISDLPAGFRAIAEHDILPGVALVALGQYARRVSICGELAHLEEQLAWYRRRFRLCRSWAMIGWQMQGWSVLHDVAQVRGARDFVFEMADWAISLQLDKNGAFLTDLAVSGPGFHTAYIAEGVAEAWRLAAAAGESERAERYADSWQRSIDFMHSLTFGETDGVLLPNPGRAIGGVRPSLSDSRLRIDYSAHLLRALVRGIALTRRGNSAPA